MGALELEGVVKHFTGSGELVRAVDGVSLGADWGEMVALRGPSGSGKSTLLLLIGGLLEPDAGAIRFDGRDLTNMSEQRRSQYLQRDVGFVYQRFPLLPRVKAIENAAVKLMLGGMSMRQAQRQARPWLERVGLGDRLGHTPEQLSAGERQRLAIARALAAEPRMILADEPTGNLDSARSREIVGLLREVAHERGAIVLLVTHDAEAAELADRKCQLRDGRLQETPSPRVSRDGDNAPDALAASGITLDEAPGSDLATETAGGAVRPAGHAESLFPTAREG
ncbi:MAG TPA: ABC transporter ATP-binding protein [Solirubrobacteraceae bacterium]|nr:ABC transporter ATP-binding protein [Solirubrobacteraceae bacterium]